MTIRELIKRIPLVQVEEKRAILFDELINRVAKAQIAETKEAKKTARKAEIVTIEMVEAFEAEEQE